MATAIGIAIVCVMALLLLGGGRAGSQERGLPSPECRLKQDGVLFVYYGLGIAMTIIVLLLLLLLYNIACGIVS